MNLKTDKCEFGVKETNFLGHVVNGDSTKMQEEKVLQWPSPKNLKQLEKFKGLAGYYRQSVISLEKSKKKKEFTWTNEDEEIFQAVKNKFKGDQILGLFDFEERSHGTHRCIGLRYRCRNQSVRRQRKKETSFILFTKTEPSGGKIFNS